MPIMEKQKGTQREVLSQLREALKIYFGNRARLKGFPSDSGDKYQEITYALLRTLYLLSQRDMDSELRAEASIARQIKNKITRILSDAEKKIRRDLKDADPRVAKEFIGLRLYFHIPETLSLSLSDVPPFLDYYFAMHEVKKSRSDREFVWIPKKNYRGKPDRNTEWLIHCFFAIHGSFEIKSNKTGNYLPPSMTDTLNVMGTFIQSWLGNIYSPSEGHQRASFLPALDPESLRRKVRAKAEEYVDDLSGSGQDPVAEGIRLYSAKYRRSKN